MAAITAAEGSEIPGDGSGQLRVVRGRKLSTDVLEDKQWNTADGCSDKDLPQEIPRPQEFNIYREKQHLV